MNAANWRAVKYIFDAALQQPAAQLARFLDDACGNDAELRAEVNRLLIEHLKVGDFLEKPLSLRNELGVGLATDAAAGPEKPFSGTARFDVRRKLGSGGFGEVYEVFDRERSAVMALKYLRTFQPEQLYRLKAEFRALADLRHPNLITVYELFSNNDPPFFTMELLNGQDFAHYLRRIRPAPKDPHARAFGKLREYLVQLCKGVIALHEADLLHRDIKPSNIFVTDRDRVVLVDFGLVKHLDRQNAARTIALAGTPHYVAPEQLEAGQLTEATDWYSVGVLLYKALTGREPFEGDAFEVLARKKHQEPPPPSAVVPGVSSILGELCQRLLNRDPLKRPSGYEVLSVLQDCAPPSGPADAAPRRSARVFVSREPHLMALQRAFEETEQGATVCLHLRGASGVGKTAVAKRFMDRIRDQHPECVILSGRCYESEAAPHKGLDELIDDLARFLKGLDFHQISPLLPRYFPLLARLFPVLQEFQPEGRPTADIPDPREQRYRAFAALRDCLARIAESYSLVAWLDDIQWADLDTIRMLNELVQFGDEIPCLILLSYRDSDIQTNPVLSTLDRTERDAAGGISVRSLEIEPLDYEEARELAAVLLQRHSPDVDGPSAAAAIARESKGNPYFVTELVRYVAPLRDRADLSVGAFGIGHVIKRRVGLLPEPAVLLLELIAVAGRPVRSEICRRAVRLDDRYFEIRSILTREHLLRTHTADQSEELDVYHDQIREAIVGYLSGEAMMVYHSLLASALEDEGSVDYEWLSVHFEASGNRDKATRYATLAANKAIEGLAFDRAARLFRRILEVGGQDETTRQSLLEQLGHALSNAGRGKEAADTFLLASKACEATQRMDLRRLACEQYLRSGHLDKGMTLGRSLLREVGLTYPEKNWTVLASLLWSRLRLRLAMRRVRGDAAAAPHPEQRLKLDVCWTVAVGLSMVDVLRSTVFQARYTLLALHSGEPSRVALGLASELAGSSIDGRARPVKNDRLFNSAIQLATRVGDHRAVAFATSMAGIVSWFTGNWHDCYEKNQTALAIYREKCSGVEWELTTASAFVLSSLMFLGRWREHALALPGLIRRAEERGDRYGASSLPLLAYAYVDALADDQPAAAGKGIDDALSSWRDEDFHVPHCDALIGRIEVSLYEGNPERAQATLDREWARLKQSHLLYVGYYQILLTALRGRSALALAASRRTSGKATGKLVKAAKRGANLLLARSAPWAKALGHLLHAGVSITEGRTNDALSSLQISDKLFDAAGMQHYTAVTRLRMSQLSIADEPASADCPSWARDQRLVNFARIADMLAPGAWRRS